MSRRRPRRRRWLKGRWVIAGILVALALDFLAFRERVSGPHAPVQTDGADGIVVLTGGSGLRIAAGMDLLASGRAERMLISGVNRDVPPDEVAARAGGDTQLYACCVDIGYQAETTRGNAREAAAWATRHGYDSLLIVTSDYHMPRALLHLQSELAGVTLTPVHVTTRIDPARAFCDAGSFRGTVVEWAKWRVTGLGLALT